MKVTRFKLGNRGITNLTPLAGLTGLKELVIYENQVTDLKPLARLTKLEVLDLHSNRIANLTPLAGLTKLEELVLKDNPNLTMAEIDKLQTALPNCRILHNAKK